MFAPLASQLDGRADLILKDLEGYAPDFPDDYGPEVELAAIKHGADAAGWDEFHLIGSSFGATVGLAFACRYPERVLSLALIEPVFLGNDTSWSDAYAALVTSLNAVLGAPLVDRPHAFPEGTLLRTGCTTG